MCYVNLVKRVVKSKDLYVIVILKKFNMPTF